MPKFDQFTGKSCVPAEELHVLEGHTGTRLHRNRWRRDSSVEQLAGNSEAVVSDPADTHDMDKLKVVEDERVIKFINARWKKDNPTAGCVGMANGFKKRFGVSCTRSTSGTKRLHVHRPFSAASPSSLRRVRNRL